MDGIVTYGLTQNAQGVNADFTAEIGAKYVVDVSGGAVTVTLPTTGPFASALVDGMSFTVLPGAGDFATNNVVITGVVTLDQTSVGATIERLNGSWTARYLDYVPNAPGTVTLYPQWAATTAYAANDVVRYRQRVYQRIAAGTSGGAFDQTEADLWEERALAWAKESGVRNSTFNASADTSYSIATDLGEFNINLPASTALLDGARIRFLDHRGVSGTNKFTVTAGSGTSIAGVGSVVNLAQDGGAWEFIYDASATSWVILGNVDQSGSYVAVHNDTTDWTAAAPDYTYSIPAATHQRGSVPIVQTWANPGGGTTFEIVSVVTTVDASGDVLISVPDTPDGRYTGRVIVSSSVGAAHVGSWNATTDWTGPAGGYYTLTFTVLAATHGKGTVPSAIQVYDDSGASAAMFNPDSLAVNASGDVTVTVLVTDVPDARFAGRVLIA